MLDVKRRITSSYYNYALSKYANLFYKLALKLTRNNECIEDLLSIAKIELIKCLMCCDRQHGSLTTFIYHRVYGAMRHWMCSYNKGSKAQYISNLQGMKEVTYVEDNTVRILATECMSVLSGREREVIDMLFFNHNNLAEISEKMSIPRSTAFKIKEKALKKMKRHAGVAHE